MADEMKKCLFLIMLGLGFALLFGCAAQAADASPQPAYSKYSPAASSVPGSQAQAQQGSGTQLTLIKFRGSSQCVSCINLGKFANSALEKNFQKELAEGKVKYLDINAEADRTNAYVQKYRPTHASLYLLTEGAGGEKYEELVQAWYYTGDEAQYSQYLTKLLRERLGG